jgi:hypothetical protein
MNEEDSEVAHPGHGINTSKSHLQLGQFDNSPWTRQTLFAPALDAGRDSIWIDIVFAEEAAECIRTKQALKQLAQMWVW